MNIYYLDYKIFKMICRIIKMDFSNIIDYYEIKNELIIYEENEI